MKIGIIGAGRIGANVGKLLAEAGHEVFYSYSRSDDKLRQLAAEAGDETRWGTPAEAVAFGEVVVLSPPYPKLDEVLDAAGPMDGKIVIDTVNPFAEDGTAYADGGTAAEEIAGKLPGAHTVKVYNHIYFEHIRTRNHEDPRLAAFIAGNDADAKTTVTQLVTDTGFEVIDLGALAMARHTEPHGSLFNKPMVAADGRKAAESLPELPH